MSSAEFAACTTVELLVPHASDLEIEDILQEADTTNIEEFVKSIRQRDLLFFDESLPVYAVLRTSYTDEDSLQQCINQVSIGIEAHAISLPGSYDQNRDRQAPSGPNRETIWSGQVDTSVDPTTLVLGSEEQGRTVLLAWKIVASLGRARIRLPSPSILFKLSASIQSTVVDEAPESEEYLPSGVPLDSNILQSFDADTAVNASLARLTVLHLSKRLPSAKRVAKETVPLTTTAHLPCRVVPALSSRIRAQKSPYRTDTPSMIGSLEIDVPPFASYLLRITSIDLTLMQGQVIDLGAGQIPKFPLTLQARDQAVCLYRLVQNSQAIAQGQGIQLLEVTLNVSIDVSDHCHPQVQVRFKANIDFLGIGSANTAKQQQKPNQPIDPKNTSVKPGDQLISPSVDTQISAAEEKLGVVVKFRAKGPVYVGEPFFWEVFVMNRSGRQKRFGLSMLHKRKPDSAKQISSRPTSISGHPRAESLAEAFTDDNLLYTTMKNYHRDNTQLICLNTDVKIGPLNPGSCYLTDMEFLPLAKGVLLVDAIRLTDYTTNEAVDIHDLPDIFAMQRK